METHEGIGLEKIKGERRLCYAILEDAVKVLREGPAYTDAATYREAKAWVRSNRTDHVFSFVNLCHVLNHEPEAIRRMIERVSK